MSIISHQPAHQANMAAIADLVLQRLLDEQQDAELPPRVEPPPRYFCHRRSQPPPTQGT
jgi:hypothetical protein